MRIIYNRIVPMRGFALNLFGFVFVRKGDITEPGFENHEAIHVEQMREMFYIGFYLWYIIEWIIKLFMYECAYKNISFEREANKYRFDEDYPTRRKRYAWLKLI